MRLRCNRRPPAGADRPLVRGPHQAAQLIRLAAPPAAGPAVALLLCDRDHRLLLAVVVEGATAGAVGRALSLVAGVASPTGVAGVVVGIVRSRGSRLGARQSAGLAGAAEGCARAGVALLDVLVVWEAGWRSVTDLAAGGAGSEDGRP